MVGFCLVLRPSGQAVPRPAPPSAVAAPIHPPPPGAAVHLTFTFWNVEWFPGRRPHAGARAQATHVAAVLPVVQQLDPDVLGLEEVGDAEAARLLADHLPGFKVDVCTEFTREGSGEPSRQQIVLCSRLPLLTAGWQRWTPDAQGRLPRRGFAFAAYRPAPGEVLLVYGLHLKSNLADEPGGDATNTAMREESTRQLLAHQSQETAVCARWGRVRLVVVGGDMNTSLDDGRFESETTLRALRADGAFRWAWEGVPLPLRLTLPGVGRYPATCFDHLFYRGDGVRLTSASLRNTGRTASDHRPVTVKFEW